MSGSKRTFLAGAKGRLLPVSVPFRYFGTAVAFHLFAWLASIAGADTLPRFAGGLGWSLAALHLVTLGVLVMTAMGASLQLMPVATRQPVYSERGPALVWWLYTPGVAAVAIGMGIASPWLLAAGGIAVLLALGGYALLLGRNLLGARGMPGVVAHGWVAFVSLLVVMASALSLALAYIGWPLLDRSSALALHVAFAAYGFMGMLSLGLSYILVPMFALANAPEERWQIASCALAALALALVALAAFGVAPRPLRVGAIALASGAIGIHLALMMQALRTGIRRELGRSFRLIRLAWGLALASLAAALAFVLEARLDGMATLFGVVLIAGWLLTFLLGVLQRIAPFLASMHAVAGKGRPPTPSTLTDDRPLAVHYWCHVAALVLLGVAVIADSSAVALVASLAGTAGALAYGVFFATLARRLAPHLAGAPAPPVA